MSNWPIVTLEEAGIRLIDCDHKTPKKQEEGLPYIGIPQLKGGRIILDGARLISEIDFNHWRRKAKPTPEDIILSRRCNPGVTAHVPEGLEIALGQNLVLLRADGTNIYPPFLRWIVRTPNWWHQVDKYINVGAIFDSLRCADIPKFEVMLPPIKTQVKIDELLKSLDERINLNHKTNQTLEQIAQAIFKCWFVDFEPVKAKQHIRNLGGNKQQSEHAAQAIIAGAITLETITNTTDLNTLNQQITQALNKKLAHQSKAQCQQLTTTASLFPDQLIESELGLIPDGWKAVVLSKMIEIIGGGTPKKSEPLYWDGNIPWFSVKDTPREGQVYVLDTDLKITERGINESSTKLLYEGTTIITARGTVGKLAFVGTPMAMNQSCYGIIGSDGIPPIFNYFNMRSAVDALQQNTHGAVFDTITRATFDTIGRALPQLEVINSFESVTEPLFHKIKNNVVQSKSLSKIRDLLLPRLLSGELTVSETLMNH